MDQKRYLSSQGHVESSREPGSQLPTNEVSQCLSYLMKIDLTSPNNNKIKTHQTYLSPHPPIRQK